MEILTNNAIMKKFDELGICYLSPSYIREAKSMQLKGTDTDKKELFANIKKDYVTDNYLKELAISYCADECQLKDISIYRDTEVLQKRILVLHYYLTSKRGHNHNVFATSCEIDGRVKPL